MSAIQSAIQSVLWSIGDSIFALFIYSLLFGIVAVFIYGFVSPQGYIARTKRKLFASLYGAVVFKDSSSVSFLYQGKLFINSILYLLASIPGLLVISIPALFVMAHLNTIFGVEYSPTTPQVISIVSDSSRTLFKVNVSAKDLKGPVRDPKNNISYYEISPESNEITVNTKDTQTYDVKKNKVTKISNSLIDTFLYPHLKTETLPSGISEITISRPEKLVAGVSWMIWFAILSMISGIAFAKSMKIQI